LTALEARIDMAVRRQATMPPAAIRQRREGRAQVRFSYVNGAVDSIALAQSSQSRLLDDAALQAVRLAAYPAPPPVLHGRRLALLLWIDFRLQGSPG
jgi:protein TonB